MRHLHGVLIEHIEGPEVRVHHFADDDPDDKGHFVLIPWTIEYGPAEQHVLDHWDRVGYHTTPIVEFWTYDFHGYTARILAVVVDDRCWPFNTPYWIRDGTFSLVEPRGGFR